jgi:hypothetical protein
MQKAEDMWRALPPQRNDADCWVCELLAVYRCTTARRHDGHGVFSVNYQLIKTAVTLWSQTGIIHSPKLADDSNWASVTTIQIGMTIWDCLPECFDVLR